MIDQANVGSKPPKRTRLNKNVKIETAHQEASDAKDIIEETSPMDPVPNEENSLVNEDQIFINPKFKKPKPTKRTTKTSRDLMGQQKIFNFFSYTNTDRKPVTGDSPAQTAPNKLDLNQYEVDNTQSETDFNV